MHAYDCCLQWMNFITIKVCKCSPTSKGRLSMHQLCIKWDFSMKFMTGVIVYHNLWPLHTLLLLWLLQVDQLYPVLLNGGVMWYLCIWKCCCPLALVSYFPDIWRLCCFGVFVVFLKLCLDCFCNCYMWTWPHERQDLKLPRVIVNCTELISTI